MRQALLTPLARLTHPRRAITGLTLATLAASALFAGVALGSPPETSTGPSTATANGS